MRGLVQMNKVNKVVRDLKGRLENSLLYLNNARLATRSSTIKSDLSHVETQINKVLDVLKKSKAMNKVLCSQCSTLHIPYAHREETFDIDEKDELKEDIERYPSTVIEGTIIEGGEFVEGEIIINYPWCRNCHLEEMEEPASWDEEHLSTLYVLEDDKK